MPQKLIHINTTRRKKVLHQLRTIQRVLVKPLPSNSLPASQNSPFPPTSRYSFDVSGVIRRISIRLHLYPRPLTENYPPKTLAGQRIVRSGPEPILFSRRKTCQRDSRLNACILRKNTCIYSTSVTIKIIGYGPDEDPDNPAHNEKRSDAEGVPFNYSVFSVYSLFEVGLTYPDTIMPDGSNRIIWDFIKGLALPFKRETNIQTELMGS